MQWRASTEFGTSQPCSLSYSKCQGKVRIAATSLSNFFDDCYMIKETYFHNGRIGTEGFKDGFKNNSYAL